MPLPADRRRGRLQEAGKDAGELAPVAAIVRALEQRIRLARDQAAPGRMGLKEDGSSPASKRQALIMDESASEAQTPDL